MQPLFQAQSDSNEQIICYNHVQEIIYKRISTNGGKKKSIVAATNAGEQPFQIEQEKLLKTETDVVFVNLTRSTAAKQTKKSASLTVISRDASVAVARADGTVESLRPILSNRKDSKATTVMCAPVQVQLATATVQKKQQQQPQPLAALLVLLQESQQLVAVLLDAETGKLLGKDYEFKIDVPSSAFATSGAVVKSVNPQALASCFCDESKTATILYSNGSIVHIQFSENLAKVKQVSSPSQKLNLDALSAKNIAIASVASGHHVVVSGQTLLLWSPGFTCAQEIVSLDADSNAKLLSVALRTAAASTENNVVLTFSTGIFETKVAISRLNLAAVLEKRQQTLRFVLAGASQDGGAGGSVISLTTEALGKMQDDWTKFSLEKSNDNSRLLQELVNEQVDDATLKLRIARLTNGVQPLTTELISAVAKRCLADRLFESFHECLKTGFVRINLIKDVDVVQSLYSADQLSLIQDILGKVPDFSPLHVVQLVRFLFKDTEDTKLSNNIPQSAKEAATAVGTALEYFIGVVFSVDSFDEVIMTKHMADLDMNEVIALLKLLGKMAEVRRLLSQSQEAAFNSFVPSLSACCLWTRVLVNCHFSAILMSERALLHLQKLRQSLQAEMSLCEVMTALPSQVKLFADAAQKNSEFSVIRPVLPSNNGGEFNYSV